MSSPCVDHFSESFSAPTLKLHCNTKEHLRSLIGPACTQACLAVGQLPTDTFKKQSESVGVVRRSSIAVKLAAWASVPSSNHS